MLWAEATSDAFERPPGRPGSISQNAGRSQDGQARARHSGLAPSAVPPRARTGCNESLTPRDRGLIFVALPARDKLRSLVLRMGVIDPFCNGEGGHSGKFCRLDCDTKAAFPSVRRMPCAAAQAVVAFQNANVSSEYPRNAALMAIFRFAWGKQIAANFPQCSRCKRRQQ